MPINHFPTFVITPHNAIPSRAQSIGVHGWCYKGPDGKQIVYSVCEHDGVSQTYTHDFDKYSVAIQGEYVLETHNQQFTLRDGAEYFTPAGVPHAGKFTASTCTIHCFGGKRV